MIVFDAGRIGCRLTSRPRLALVTAVAVGILMLAGNSSHGAEAKISFNRQIQPILSDKCYRCHGPDSTTRKPKKQPLRIDRANFAFEPRDDGKPVLIKGDPEHSRVFLRITSTDDDEVMPPPAEHKKLTGEEVALIRAWIKQGAEYEQHWSYIRPAKATLPSDAYGWARNPIDNFVEARLKEAGLKPNAEEQKTRLLRRVCFDLTGLPPSRAELEAFLNDHTPGAYEKVVDRLLASDASAEHFTRYWLDAARYADTQGIHHDHKRSVWPFRDWVIRSYKSNKPFDQFTVEQIAGDLLPNATMDQKIASGFNRLLPTTGEGGAIPDEYAAIYAKDRVDTVAALWLGTTSGCATCHDHKFDPLTKKDFYSLTAFFRHNDIPILDDPNDANVKPAIFVPRDPDRARWPVLQSEIETQKGAWEQRKKEALPEFEKWLVEGRAGVALPAGDSVHLPLNVSWPGQTNIIAGPYGDATMLSGDGMTTSEKPVLTRSGSATFGAFVRVEETPSGALISRMEKSESYRGWDLFLSEGKPTVHIIDKYPEAALKITARESLSPGAWHHVMAVFDGSAQGAAAARLYVDGRELDVEVNNNSLGTNITSRAPFRLGARTDKDGVSDPIKNGKAFLQDVRFYPRVLSAAEIGRLAMNGLMRSYIAGGTRERSADETNRIYSAYLAGRDKTAIRIAVELSKLRREERGIRARGGTSLIMEEKKDGEAEAYVLTRGNYLAKAERVTANTPAALPPMTPDEPRNRLGLAEWLVSPVNPLTARVTANRLWSELFGYGIVETTEDLGVMGARPVNQQLLDWLAVDFMESKWDYRRLVRLMVTSATYRQSARGTSEKIEKDPLNKLVSRGPHYRLDAEEIRDLALASSGLLVRTVGGPPTRPYQPEGIWEAVAMQVSNTRVYQQDHGDNLYRRSLYTFWKRTAPPPAMEILDAPERSVFCTRRDRNDTPLQAFVTLNDPQFVEAARTLAARALRDARKFDDRLDEISESLIARTFNSSEREIMRKLFNRALAEYQGNPSAANSLVSVGESASDPRERGPELAAWSVIASEILNMDECLTK